MQRHQTLELIGHEEAERALLAAFASGMPAMSFRGGVREDFGDPVGTLSGYDPVRLRSTSHDVTESAEIAQLWPGLKQGLLFAITYAGLAN